MPVVHRPSYEFSSKPRPVKPRPKFRPDIPGGGGGGGGGGSGGSGGSSYLDDAPFPMNIHHDPRVARGNTFALGLTDRGSSPPATRTASKRAMRRARCPTSTSSFFNSATFSQPTQREEIDLTRFLVEPGEDESRPEQDTETQTDEFLPRPQTPDFVPKKTGVDMSTQIESSDNLFNFDLEVQPLLAVLVGKTLEQARIEVEREHELECIRQAALALNRQREEEARRIDALKEAAVAMEREKTELRRRKREQAAARRVAKEKVACVQLMRQLLPLSLDAAMADLTKNSWVTPSAHQIKTIFLPDVLDRVAAGAARNVAARGILHDLHGEVDQVAETLRNRRIETRRRAREEREKTRLLALQRPIRLYVPPEMLGRDEDSERLGPIEARAGDTLEGVEAVVAAWVMKAGASEGEDEDGVFTPEGGFLAGFLRKARTLARRNDRGGGNVGGGSRRTALGMTSTLLEVQEQSGLVSDEILLDIIP